MIDHDLQAPEISARALGVDGHPSRRIRTGNEGDAASVHLDVDKIRALGAAAQTPAHPTSTRSTAGRRFRTGACMRKVSPSRMAPRPAVTAR